jgi:hypothetical protein
MKSKRGQGKDTLLHLRKCGKGQDYKLVKQEERLDEDVVEQAFVDTLDQSVSFHRTIPLGNWEFGRVGMGIRYGLPLDVSDSEKDEAYGLCFRAITEVLDREEACVKGEKRKDREVVIGGLGIAVYIWMDYGLTFKGALPNEVHKVDLTSSRLISDGGNVEDSIASLQSELGDRIERFKKDTLDPESDPGF